MWVEVSGFAKKPRRKPEDKWTKVLISLGYCTVPSILIWAQGRLKLTTEQFTAVMQLSDFWWDVGEPPFPTKELLAGRMGMGERQVQRHLTALERKSIIKRVHAIAAQKIRLQMATIWRSGLPLPSTKSKYAGSWCSRYGMDTSSTGPSINAVASRKVSRAR
jgi:Helix-turn-helix domain